jgi:hypothetical protein
VIGVNVQSKAAVGLAKELPEGPARLLAALVQRGLGPEHLLVAAALVRELDRQLERGAESSSKPV